MPSRKVLYRAEVLLSNNVDADLQDMFKPLNFLQLIHFSPKYTIKDGYITPNSLIRNIWSVAGAFIFVSVCIFRTVNQTAAYDTFNTMLLISKYFDVILYSIGFLVSAYVNIAYSNVNVLLYIKLQTIKGFIPRNEILKKVKFYCVILILILFFGTLTMYLMFHLSFHYFDFFDLATDWAVLSFDLNLVYASSVLNFLAQSLEELNKEIWRLGNARVAVNKDGSKPNWKGINLTYIDILEAYNYFKEAFRLLIFFHTFNTFTHVFIHIQSIIELCKIFNPGDDYRVAITVGVVVTVWFFRNITLQYLVGVSCQNFYAATGNTQSICAVQVGSIVSDEHKLFLKAVRRLNNAVFYKWNMYGMFIVDATLPLRLMEVIATYTVVFLQFAFQ